METSGKHLQRIGYGILAGIGLALIYLFQFTDFLYLFTGLRFPDTYHFIVNRLFRIVLNDTCMLVLIYALFRDRQVVKLAFYVQLVDIFILLPLYLALKLPAEGVSELSSPFLSQFHRLIVNPTLMILLIGGVYYQNLGKKRAI